MVENVFTGIAVCGPKTKKLNNIGGRHKTVTFDNNYDQPGQLGFAFRDWEKHQHKSSVFTHFSTAVQSVPCEKLQAADIVMAPPPHREGSMNTKLT